jgi:hypothetical protein
MGKRRDTRPAADSQRLRTLVHLALHDESTYIDDGAFDELVRPSSERHAFELRRLLALSDPSEDDARFILSKLREPDVAADRAVVLISNCMAVLHLREPFWSHCLAELVREREPRLRILAVRSEAYAYESAIADEASEVRVAALHYGGWRRPAILRQALRDADAKVRGYAAAYVLTLPEWREECARLTTDPDAGVRAEAHKQLAAGIGARGA